MRDAAVDVAIVFPAAHERGGVERIVWDLAHYLVERGRRVAFVGNELQEGADERISFVRIATSAARGVRLPAPLLFRRAAAQALELVQARTVVSIGANCPPGDVYMVQSVHRAWLAAAKKVPLAGRQVTAQVRYILPRHQVLLALEWQYFTRHRPRTIICTSKREEQDLLKLYGVAAETIRVIPNGFDANTFTAARLRDRAASRWKMGADDEDVIFLLMANELHRKGFSVLLAALAGLADPRARVDVVGRTGLQAYAGEMARLGVSDRVRWHGSTTDAALYYAGADVLALPTQYEPFGLVIIEALATGLPVLTTRVAGAADAVQPGVNGLLQTDPYDVAELTGLMRRAMDAEQRSRWAAAAPASVQRFRQDLVFAQVTEHL